MIFSPLMERMVVRMALDARKYKKFIVTRINVLYSAGYSITEIVKEMKLPEKFILAAIDYGQKHGPKDY